MPTARRAAGRRTGVYGWRVKLGNQEVFKDPRKGNCEEWMRKNGHLGKLKLVAPNYPHK